MDSNRLEVQKYITSNFNLLDFWVKEFPLLPGGVVLEDSEGEEILVYWDIVKQKIKWEVR